MDMVSAHAYGWIWREGGWIMKYGCWKHTTQIRKLFLLIWFEVWYWTKVDCLRNVISLVASMKVLIVSFHKKFAYIIIKRKTVSSLGTLKESKSHFFSFLRNLLMFSNLTLHDHGAYHLVNHVCPCGLHLPRLSICESELSYIKQLQLVTNCDTFATSR